eukprot:SAG11_NODE_1580_length_4651_cov_5.701011_3_plen_208_part_00
MAPCTQNMCTFGATTFRSAKQIWRKTVESLYTPFRCPRFSGADIFSTLIAVLRPADIRYFPAASLPPPRCEPAPGFAAPARVLAALLPRREPPDCSTFFRVLWRFSAVITDRPRKQTIKSSGRGRCSGAHAWWRTGCATFRLLLDLARRCCFRFPATHHASQTNCDWALHNGLSFHLHSTNFSVEVPAYSSIKQNERQNNPRRHAQS